MCTNRKAVIELNSKIYNKLKEATNMVADLESQYQKDKKCKDVGISQIVSLSRRKKYKGQKRSL